MFSFKADGGTAAVTGNYFDIIGESQNFVFDGVDQNFVIAAGEICTADRTAENRVPGNEDLFLAVVKEKTAAAHSVTGKSQNFSIGQGGKAGCRRQIFGRREVGEEAVFGTGVHFRIGGGNFHLFDIERLCHFTAGGDVVNVGVSEQNTRLFKWETFCGGDDLRRIGTRVDDQEQFFIIKKDERTIGGNGAYRKRFYSKHYFFLSSRITCLNAGVLSCLFNLKSRGY